MKTFNFLVLFLFGCLALQAQVINDDACDALPVQCGQQINSTTAFALPDTLPFCGTGNGTGGGVWYSITPVADTQITLSLCGTDDYDSRIRVFSGQCNALSCVVGEDDDFLRCLSDDPEVSFVPNSGETYSILIYGYGDDAGIFTLDISCVDDCPLLGNIGDDCDDGNPNTTNDVVLPNCSCLGVAPPVNDEPCSASVLNCGTTLYNQSLVGSTLSEADDCGGTGMGDVWYTFTADGMQNYTFSIIDPDFEFDGVLELYQSDFCTALLLWEGCTDGPETYTISAQGTYFVKVRSYAEGETSSFGVKIECSPFDCPEVGNIGDPCNDGNINTANDVLGEDCICAGTPKPFNDKACNALPLECGDVLTNQSSEGAEEGSCNSPSVWYAIEVDSTKTYRIETIEESARYRVYQGIDCDNLTVYGDEYDNCKYGSQEINEIGFYYVEVAGYGLYGFEVICLERVENDTPCTATEIDCGFDLSSISMQGAGYGGFGICDTTRKDRWYKLDIQNDTTVYQFDLGYYGELEIFKGDACGALTPFTASCVQYEELEYTRVGGQDTFYFRISSSSASFDLNVNCSPRRINDTPCGALPLSCNSPIEDQSFYGSSMVQTDLCEEDGVRGMYSDLWYVFDIENENDFEKLRILASAGGSIDPEEMKLWTGADCSNLEIVDLCGSNIDELPAGQYYFQHIIGIEYTFDFDLYLDCYSESDNDDCEDAEELVCGEVYSKQYSQYYENPSIPSSCIGSQDEDAYFFFEGTAGAEYSITIWSGNNPFFKYDWDGGVAVYRSNNCENFSLENELVCVGDFQSIPHGDESVSFTAPQDGRYYVRVYEYYLYSFQIGIDCNTEIPECTAPYPTVESSSLASVVNTNSVEVSWTPVMGSVGCQVQGRPLGSTGAATLTQGGINVGGLTIPGGALQAGTTYEWRVRCGCSQSPLIAGEWSDYAQFTFEGLMIQTSPNPTDGLSNVSFYLTTEGQATLELIDLSGKLVQRIYQGYVGAGQEMRFQFDGSVLPNGVYLYRLTTAQEVVIEKLMIAR